MYKTTRQCLILRNPFVWIYNHWNSVPTDDNKVEYTVVEFREMEFDKISIHCNIECISISK